MAENYKVVVEERISKKNGGPFQCFVVYYRNPLNPNEVKEAIGFFNQYVNMDVFMAGIGQKEIVKK